MISLFSCVTLDQGSKEKTIKEFSHKAKEILTNYKELESHINNIKDDQNPHFWESWNEILKRGYRETILKTKLNLFMYNGHIFLINSYDKEILKREGLL